MARGKYWKSEEDAELLRIVEHTSKIGLDNKIAFQQFIKNHKKRTIKACERRLSRLTETPEPVEPVQECFDLGIEEKVSKKVFTITYDKDEDLLYWNIGDFSVVEVIGLLEHVKSKLLYH